LKIEGKDGREDRDERQRKQAAWIRGRIRKKTKRGLKSHNKAQRSQILGSV
jgi:hypothetical protein